MDRVSLAAVKLHGGTEQFGLTPQGPESLKYFLAGPLYRKSPPTPSVKHGYFTDQEKMARTIGELEIKLLLKLA